MKAISAFSLLIFMLSLLFVQSTERSDTSTLLLGYSCCFAAFLFLYFNDRNSHFKIKLLMGVGIILRFTLIFFDPNLSDDYLRFIWDGNLQLNGINSFAHTPEFLFENHRQEWMEKIYPALNSPGFYSVYPAVCQYIALISAAVFPGSLKAVFALKFFIWIAEVITIFSMFKLVKRLKFDLNNVLLYALNPLIIIELTGNIHFDAFAISFTMVSILLMLKGKYSYAGILFGLAIASKLTPLIIIPFLLFSLKLNKFLIGGLSCLLTLIILHIPFSGEISSMLDSLFLYFDYFEFNASLYALSKWLFISFDRYNEFMELKIILPILTIISIVLFQFFYRRSDLRSIGLIISVSWLIFFLFSTTIHPWYISMIVAAGVLSNLKFPLTWSFLIFLTYAAYYFSPPNLAVAVVIAEYTLLLIVIFKDIRRLKEPNFSLNS